VRGVLSRSVDPAHAAALRRANEKAHVAHRNLAPLDIFAVRASLVAGESDANSDRPLDGDQTDLLLLHFDGHSRFRRELEDGCLLAFIQAREEESWSAG
jgi:hypothetical protein